MDSWHGCNIYDAWLTCFISLYHPNLCSCMITRGLMSFLHHILCSEPAVEKPKGLSQLHLPLLFRALHHDIDSGIKHMIQACILHSFTLVYLCMALYYSAISHNEIRCFCVLPMCQPTCWAPKANNEEDWAPLATESIIKSGNPQLNKASQYILADVLKRARRRGYVSSQWGTLNPAQGCWCSLTC